MKSRVTVSEGSGSVCISASSPMSACNRYVGKLPGGMSCKRNESTPQKLCAEAAAACSSADSFTSQRNVDASTAITLGQPSNSDMSNLRLALLVRPFCNASLVPEPSSIMSLSFPRFLRVAMSPAKSGPQSATPVISPSLAHSGSSVQFMSPAKMAISMLLCVRPAARSTAAGSWAVRSMVPGKLPSRWKLPRHKSDDPYSNTAIDPPLWCFFFDSTLADSVMNESTMEHTSSLHAYTCSKFSTPTSATLRLNP
mmetsp:Transcript_85560/g.169807  ORF Transcript_85560/g.169807 Transcript_85560/m.169807 type:complete len:254 (-) Transcript_85560:298-1059(-)